MVAEFRSDLYLARIGIDDDVADVVPNLDTLRRLHHRHLRSVPFETLDIHRDRPLSLDVRQLFRKVVAERRGGFCYELNGLFAVLLEELGFPVTRLSGRVHSDSGAVGPEFDHLTLEVEVGGTPWLADVGFGECFDEPIPLNERDGASAEYFLTRSGGHWELRRRQPEGDERILYTFTTRRRRLEDFEEMCRFHQSPRSTFARAPLCSRRTARGRITLNGRKLTETASGAVTERELETDAEWDATLRERFGIRLDVDTRL